MTSRFDDVVIGGTLRIKDTGISKQTRGSLLVQEDLARFPVLLSALRVWDAFQTNLPGTAATDDLAVIGGTFASAPPTVQAGDLKAAGATTRYARFLVAVPECFVAGETLNLVFSAGMTTTVADTSCTLDLQAYRLDKDGGIGSDLCLTAATTINSTSFADKSFSLDPATLAPGDVLDCRIAIACNDAATVTAVIPTVASIDVACDIKG